MKPLPEVWPVFLVIQNRLNSELNPSSVYSAIWCSRSSLGAGYYQGNPRESGISANPWVGGGIRPLCNPSSDVPVLPVSGGGGAREKRTTASHICCFSRTTLFAVLVLWNQRYIYSFHCTCRRRQKTNKKTHNVSQHLLILPQFENRRDSLKIVKIIIIWHKIVCWFMVFSPFFPVLVCCDHKIGLHQYENQSKNNLEGNHKKSSEIN